VLVGRNDWPEEVLRARERRQGLGGVLELQKHQSARALQEVEDARRAQTRG
jgi:hypothetical protein